MPGLNVTKVAEFHGHRDSIYAMDFDPHTGKFYSAGADGFLVEWNWPESTDGMVLARMPEPAYSVLYTPDRIYWGSSTGILYIIDTYSNKLIRSVHLHKKGLFSICRSADEEILTGGGDGFLIRLDPEGNVLERIQLSEKSIRKVLVAPESIWVAGSDYKIRELSRTDRSLKRVLHGHQNSVFDLVLNGQMLISAGRDARIRKWDTSLSDNEFIRSVDAHWFTIHSLAIRPEGDLLLSASMDKSIRIWSADLTLLKEVNRERDDGHNNAVNKVLWIDSNHFISCSDDRAIKLFHVSS